MYEVHDFFNIAMKFDHGDAYRNMQNIGHAYTDLYELGHELLNTSALLPPGTLAEPSEEPGKGFT